MLIHIVAHKFSQTCTLRDMVEQHVRQALGRIARRIAETVVCFDDLNGPRGGIDLRCRIKLRLEPRGEVNVTADAADPSLALAKAVRRAERCLQARLERRSTLRRRPRFWSGFGTPRREAQS